MQTINSLPYGGIDLAASAKNHGLRIERCEKCGQEETVPIDAPSEPCRRCKRNEPRPTLPDYPGLDREEWRAILYEARRAYNRGEMIDDRFSLTEQLAEAVLAKLNNGALIKPHPGWSDDDVRYGYRA